MPQKKRGRPIVFHDAYHRKVRQLMRESRARQKMAKAQKNRKKKGKS